MNRGLKITAGIVVIAAALVYWTFQSLQGNQVYYMTVKDLQAAEHINPSTRIKLGGTVQSGSIQLLSPMAVDFRLMQDSSFVNVKFQGVIPDMFKEDADVIVEGSYHDQVFIADNLIAKCASKYETDFSHEEMGLDSLKETED